MDRMLYISMNAAQQTMLAQATNANNLANVNTTGFRADLEQFRSMPVFGEGLPTRVYSMTERPATDYQQGSVQSTGRELDISVQGEGFIAVMGKDGREGYTRAGDLHVTEFGQLVTGTGLQVMGEGGPIAIPPAEKMDIGVDGTISIRPIGGAENELAIIDRIKLVKPDLQNVFKDSDGLMRMADGTEAPLDATVKVASGTIEGSNVNAVGALVNMIELQRKYEMQVKMMSTAEENSAASARMLQING
ncbi:MULTISPECIES: flagellar basal-body rod protein FlgF [Methylophaga]|jgi:flagellar basal-body rod protein FlgF|uniref:Flagellar basal-body rod protein FlgF n=1 Tax=Methylophaga muralis TaxID=291169 RepID=A0A1E3GPL5_9GAMM|nr:MULTISPECIES: flagellar basal-body rod protein FlgF [Methylophaga]MDO8824985.1 flagellar basal-body rod protein FlgF [Methylophaga sp.]ODN65988.1 Flagellar basal-body rod protein FlgF [Methylophaga muralis]THK40998.1 flagellar basal-body rod protein FlgF [Methylophaga sp. SB9B]